MSTANLFNLPFIYQYGVRSAGFGAWRELATHIMTTNWVITGECANFPIMYHWRILPSHSGDININYWGNIEEYCQYWENSDVIRKRVENLNHASAHIALFLEYVPQNLHDWLNAQIAKGVDSSETAVVFVDEQLKATNKHMNASGLMHFDAHFENILTDGKQLYLSDFGLALSSKFDLTLAETEFLKQHQSYDQACAAVNLLHCIITSLFGKEHWEIRLREYPTGELSKAPQIINTIINRYAPMALLMDEFFQKLQKESKSTPYPATQLEKLLRAISSETT
jgi:thiamine kinase-like enzyme